MEKKRTIVQYRQRLDKTLASPDLRNEDALKALVKRQLRSSEQDIEGYEYEEKALETRAAEVSKFLDMLRSVDDGDRSKTSHTDWKLKQDDEEFRVMYREGPEGSPFHTLLAEGYVDGPVDVCLCMSWETSLYKKWWPQFTVPPFKILLSDCLQRVRIGEQLSLVRVKAWPLSTREAVLHYYLFEYVEDDLIVVLLNTIPDLKSINGTLYGFDNEAIPEAKDVIRIDVVGGFALQKVTSDRSYFRTIANMDIKVDIVPPSLINFVSRQLIGSGFRLYQKAVASRMDHGEAFIKTLGEPLYLRVREALYGSSGSEKAMDAKELQRGVNIRPDDVIESTQDETKDASQEDNGNYNANNYGVALDNSNAYSEIMEADAEETERIEEEDVKVNDVPIDEVNARSQLKAERNVHIRPEVEQALETLEKAISVVREIGFHSRQLSPSFSFPCAGSPLQEKGDVTYSYSPRLGQLVSKNEAITVKVLNNEILEENSREALGTNPDILSLRRTGTNFNLKEVNYNKVVPASPEQNVSEPISSSENGAKETPTLDQNTADSNKQTDVVAILDMSSDQPKTSSRLKTHQYCCFLPPLRGKSSMAKSIR